MSMNKYMHPRNRYRQPPDFTALALAYPALAACGQLDLNGRVRLDFRHPETLRLLTASLLHRDFGLTVRFPAGKLVPTLPLRLNYVLWIEDIMQAFNVATKTNLLLIPPPIRGIDIGCGASCIYPLLVARMTRNWAMYALESNRESVAVARENVRANHSAGRIEVVQQPEAVDGSGLRIFDELLRTLEEKKRELLALVPDSTDTHIADFCMCNPPFFAASSAGSADQPPSTAANRTGHRPAPRLRLACDGATPMASSDELATGGGELAFIRQLIAESLELRTRIRVYTTMCGHKSTFVAAARLLAESGVTQIGRTEFCQGRTTRWALAWSFDERLANALVGVPATGPTCGKTSAAAAAAQTAANKRKPFTFAVPANSPEQSSMLQLQQRLEAILADIGVPMTAKQHVSADLWMCRVVAQNLAWANQRRRRRELQRAEAEASKQRMAEQKSEEGGGMDVQGDATSPVAGNESNDDESFYDDEGEQEQQQEQHQAEPDGKRFRLDGDADEEMQQTESEAGGDATSALSVQLSLVRSTKGDVQLEMQFESGTSGRDGAYQLMQFIQNRWK